MSIDDRKCELHITSSPTNAEGWSCLCKVGEKEANLYENRDYLFSFRGVVISRFFIDDVELLRSAEGSHYSWSAGFFAGKVEMVALDSTGQKHHFFAVVSPSSGKLSPEMFSSMFQEIRQFDARLLLGYMAATAGFGIEKRSASFDSLVALGRLKLYGENYLKSMSAISQRPHKLLRPVHQRVSLSAIKRLHPTSMMDRRLLAVVGGHAEEQDSMESIQLLSQVSLPSFDTPANRAMKALLLRFLTNVRILNDLVGSGRLAQEQTDQSLRKPHRLEFLRTLQSGAEKLLKTTPFIEVTKTETSSAGLTHIAAHPLYSRAYRQGAAALRSGIEGDKNQDELNVSPTWGVYETWCYVHLLRTLEEKLKLSAWKPNASTTAKAELSLVTTLSNGACLEALFQAKFRSENPSNGKYAWSLSRERYPDIVFVIWEMGQPRFLVLDAKYRSGRTNVLEAMESAHIYHDSLRIGDVKAEKCLLLLPGEPDVQSLEKEEFWNEHHVGAVSQFSYEQPGVARCIDMINIWCRAAPFEARIKLN